MGKKKVDIYLKEKEKKYCNFCKKYIIKSSEATQPSQQSIHIYIYIQSLCTQLS